MDSSGSFGPPPATLMPPPPPPKRKVGNHKKNQSDPRTLARIHAVLRARARAAAKPDPMFRASGGMLSTSPPIEQVLKRSRKPSNLSISFADEPPAVHVIPVVDDDLYSDLWYTLGELQQMKELFVQELAQEVDARRAKHMHVRRPTRFVYGLRLG